MEIARVVVSFGMAAALILWSLWLVLRKSRDPARLVFQLVFTAGVMGLLFWYVRDAKGLGQVVGIAAAWICGAVLAVVWAPVITDVIGRAVGGLFDGGDQEIEPRPYYSAFQALRAKGRHLEALAEVRRQLERFPNDFQGMMFLAELQAENLDDLPGAQVTVERLCAQTGHAPANIAYAWNRIADWHLGLLKDRDGAKRALERIIELLPDTEMSLQAAQRIARLADTETLLAPQERRQVSLEKGVENIGLMQDSASLVPEDEDPALKIARCVKHLEEHPLDGHTRENLAMLYADHYQRMDLAQDQLEHLIQQPNQPAKQVVRWLNLLADLQVRHGAEAAAVRATLERIIALNPDVAAAKNAQRRLDALNLEIAARRSQTKEIKLGTYEQNIGLKIRKRGHPPE